ncbi:glutamate-1-semialdehyde 2,1-aminomutase [Paenibacillus flagellatus]|uniref:Glutamate-1-semialdehyde 2,1-aminomutase n=1 Tax=Paenibacillus flagellatus TaxID=2211139 RepID=A0A2V5KBU3_9BACL|nr:glutamate-1-semialdehyde 2,1-aminomutase [Paenibacillus flagellatus]PYI55614.1 glutamate-1-semialdehyde-2,1-aminomutase [Paenibacillus flagellatus]
MIRNAGRREKVTRMAFDEAKRFIPGGVNSPVRAFGSVGLTPVMAACAKGARLWDIDGNEYIDYIGSWGPLILGHAHPSVVEAVRKAAGTGTSFGLTTLTETGLARLICERVPSVEMVRMVNSGTEAVMSALRLARGYTGRPLVLKFEGGYHGHADDLLSRSGSGIATLGLPDSIGVPESVAAQTVTVPYNRLDEARHAFERFGERIAAVIVEPVAGNMGVVPPQPGFLEGLRSLTSRYGSLLVFDEVMTGFRVGFRGAQGLYGVTPDLTCFGKIIGGGLPVGAYGGRRDIMELVAPSGPIYQAGTLSGNPLAMAAGFMTLQLLAEPGVYDMLERRAARLEEGFARNAERAGVPLRVNRVGSMLCAYFTEREVVDFETVQSSDMQAFRPYYAKLLELGVLTPPTPFEAMFVSAAHAEDEIEATIRAQADALQTIQGGTRG